MAPWSSLGYQASGVALSCRPRMQFASNRALHIAPRRAERLVISSALARAPRVAATPTPAPAALAPAVLTAGAALLASLAWNRVMLPPLLRAVPPLPPFASPLAAWAREALACWVAAGITLLACWCTRLLAPNTIVSVPGATRKIKASLPTTLAPPSKEADGQVNYSVKRELWQLRFQLHQAQQQASEAQHAHAQLLKLQSYGAVPEASLPGGASAHEATAVKRIGAQGTTAQQLLEEREAELRAARRAMAAGREELARARLQTQMLTNFVDASLLSESEAAVGAGDVKVHPAQGPRVGQPAAALGFLQRRATLAALHHEEVEALLQQLDVAQQEKQRLVMAASKAERHLDAYDQMVVRLEGMLEEANAKLAQVASSSMATDFEGTKGALQCEGLGGSEGLVLTCAGPAAEAAAVGKEMLSVETLYEEEVNPAQEAAEVAAGYERDSESDWDDGAPAPAVRRGLRPSKAGRPGR